MSNYSFCEQCGKPLSENTKFCPECGWKVPAEASNVENPAVQKQPEPVAAGNNTSYAPNNFNTNQYSSNTYAGNTYQANQQFQPNQQFQGNPQYQGGQQFQNQFPNNQQQYPGNPYPGNNYAPNNYVPKAKKSSAPIIITVVIIALLAIAAVLYFVVLKPGSGIKAEDLRGSWNGYLTITDIKGEEASSENMNKPVTMTGELDISSSGKGNATLTIESSDDKGTVTYSGGDIKITVTEGGGTITFDGSVEKSGGQYIASGKFTGSMEELKITGTWKMTKSAN